MEPLDLNSQDFEQRLALLFRQAMVGRCVNGVTHDVNNYLGAVLAYAELIGYETNLSAESRRMLDEIVEGIKRSSDLLGTLTGIARKDKQRVSLVYVEDLLRHNLQLQQYTNRLSQIQVENDFSDEPRSLTANAPRLEIAFLCLLHNAMEAVEDAPRRLIRLRTHYSQTHCTVEFWDSGPGLQCEDLAYQEYFTSKNSSHVGLGLPFAKQVIQEHGGTIRFAKGQGMIIELPYENGLRPSM